MASELARAMDCSADEASENLMSLSPHEMKTLLHRIVTGTEFIIKDRRRGAPGPGGHHRRGEIITKTAKTKAEKTGISSLQEKIKAQRSLPSKAGRPGRTTSMTSKKASFDEMEAASELDEDATSTVGQWLRRRRIDGALNRVPRDFYGRIWRILRRFESIRIKDAILHQNLTKEMTQGETKFALTIESVLNQIPEPEYRQLMVEAIMVLALISEAQTRTNLRIPADQHGSHIIEVHGIVHAANGMFVEDQKEHGGESTNCCGRKPPESCNGVAGLCIYFIDSAPSGRFGTLTYLCRAAAHLLHQGDEDIECSVS